MRVKNIEVAYRFPVMINEPDCNGNVYTENAFISACKNVTEIPIVQHNDNGENVVVGVANKLWYADGCINVEGIAWYGGFCEDVKFNDHNNICEMELKSIGICK